ncbi:SusC/RagA family TonB-linked outer membrane protein [Flavobacterium gawalongense]|uniref:TonB-dependent receptor n=1 Tax=Flavobacterium gawalongense TaxID=2594432 RepID=A0A553BF74_9FLAO|nr:TonB-dependent receptor [Flavobacterium gawalongense]TRW99753.1 TonB-dependent receptor [Flavobacterium gawalongense]TRX03860.1 TonB-dependent receptor [Flavobacterium gawalongense]TRX06887.1 TonB-dependent receptor [Flavobacterium gawalongense]TRX07618.1 TonB-dependent receptor [Flavobacterium gawalongense]TRX23494.1 TonB-dependent receptor [Flavobacterium gawalongense]
MKFTKLFIFCFLSILFSVYGQAQDVTVSGKVYDENGLPIPGVSILIKGTSKATASDFDGNYQIKATPKGTLEFSYLGYNTTQESINGRNRIDVKLNPSTESLQEVVVVGYGTQKKSVVTGAISSVRAKDLEKVPNGRIEQALQGRVSGVTIAASSGQPGASSTIRIRGVTTFGEGGNDPLWVVDGVVVDAGGIGFLNQSDIESIEVLKDAASAAIYGTRAATGVILVTTKKGKSGKISVNYNGFTGISSPEKTLNLLNATQYGALLNEKSVAAGGPVIFPNLSALGVGTDWQKAIFNTSAFRYSHELSISGGSDVSNFYASFGIQDQEGIVSTEISNYTKKNFRLNSTHKLSKVFTFGQTFGFSRQKTIGIGNTNSEFGGPLSSAINLDPTTPLIETDPVKANSAPYSTNPVIRDANGSPYGISSLVGQEMTNPLAYAKTRLGGYGTSDDLVGNAYLEAAITKHIKVRSTLGAKLSSWGGQGFTPVFYLSATSNVLKNSYSKSENKSFAWNIENIVTYANQFGNHNLTVLLGQGSYVDNIGGGSGSTMFGLPITDYRDASFNFDIPQSDRSSSTYDLTEHKLTSLFARVNYDFKEKYLFTGIIRRDGSSRFGANNKFGVFPSFNLGWVLTKEDFWKESNVLNTLKIRGGYGVVGNDAIPNFRYLSLVEGGYNYSFGNTGAITTGYANLTLDNPDLQWEETSQTNIGFESKFFNAINLTVDLYKKSTSGILRSINIPGYVGVASNPTGNVADMDNKGIEVELGYKKKFGEVNFSVNGNVAYLENKVTYVASDSNYIAGDASFQSMGPVTRTQVGQSYNSFYGFKTAGIFQNEAEIAAYTNASGGLIQPSARPGDFRWVDTDGNGSIGDDDKQFLGSNIPKYTFGLTLNFDYKNFDFMAFAQGAAGNKIFQGLRRLDVGNANYQTIALSRWTGEGTSNDYPRLTNNDANGNFGKMSDFYLEDGNYLRLKLVQFGYSLPSDAISKIGASKVRFYITAENLLTLTKYTGYDPEIGGGVFGIDKGIYPQARTFMFGANLQF